MNNRREENKQKVVSVLTFLWITILVDFVYLSFTMQMEGHIAADLYGEALQQSSIESFPTSAADYTLNDAQGTSFSMS